MRVIIHGGKHKTGTTSLQMSMQKARATLASLGIHYPAARDGQHVTLLDPRRPDWTPDRLVAERATASAQGAHTLFLSLESVSLLSADQFHQISGLFAQDDLEFLFVFRNWHTYWPSRWAQNCSRRDTQGFAGYLDMISRPDLAHPDLHFDLAIERALATRAAVVALSFESALRHAQGLVAAILAAAGLSGEAIDAVMLHETRVNERLPWQVTEVLRLLNGILANVQRRPQDDLCLSAAEARMPAASFWLSRAWSSLDPDLANRLVAIVTPHGADRHYDVPAVATAVKQLNRYANLFANSNGGPALENPSECRVTTTDLDWRGFMDDHRELAIEAVRLLWRRASQIATGSS